MTVPQDESAPLNHRSRTSADGLGICAHHRVWVGGNNATLRAKVDRALHGILRPPMGEIDAAILTPASIDEALYFSAKVRSRMSLHGTLIVLVPTSELVRNAGADVQIMDALVRQGWSPVNQNQPTSFAGHVVLRLGPVRVD